MRNVKAALIVFIAFISISIAFPQGTQAQTASPILTDSNGLKYLSNRILVKPSLPAKRSEVMSFGALARMTAVKEFTHTGILVLDLPPFLSVEDAVAFYQKSGLIEFAEPDYVVQADGLTIPNDRRFGRQWGLHNTGGRGCTADADIDAPEAWNKTTGSRDFIIAVLDTGIDYNHKDLKRNIWVNEAEKNGIPGVDDDGNGYVDDVYGIDTFNGDSDPMDDNFHGTHVAGTIGAVGDNGRGVAGVMWQARIMALKFLNASGSGYTSGAIEALEYVLDMKKNHGHDIRVTNNSWGGGGESTALRSAIRQLRKEGILFVASAGNGSKNNDLIPHYPSSYPLGNIIAVASTDCWDQLSWFSNWGPTRVDVAAPGSDIFSTFPGDQYGYLSGTSMAAPHVAGLAGLIWAQQNDWSWKRVRNRIYNRGDYLSTLEGLVKKERRINASRAVPH